MSKQKNIGTTFESKVQNKIIANGGIAFRLALNGSKDIGDILSIEKDGLHFIECKTRKGKALPSELEKWKKECQAEIANIKLIYGFENFKFSLFYENRKTNEITGVIIKDFTIKENKKSLLEDEKDGIDLTPEIKNLSGATAKQKKYIYVLLTEIAKMILSTPKKILQEVQVSAGLRCVKIEKLSFDEASIIIEELNFLKKEIEK